MKIPSITLRNIRCFRGDHKIDLSPSINLFVGHNNSGKSTILKALYQLQGTLLSERDISVVCNDISEVIISLEKQMDKYSFNGNRYPVSRLSEQKEAWISFKPGQMGVVYAREIYNPYNQVALSEERVVEYDKVKTYSNMEPENLIYPIFSNRKVNDFKSDTSESQARHVSENFENLCAKVERLKHPNKKKFTPFNEVCIDVLGFEVGIEGYDKEKHIVFYVDDDTHIPITSMGAGIPNLLGIIVNLFTAENKIFLIEEPENDLHPKALKTLLNLITKSSSNNQFIISTHSNIVVRHLGAVEGSKVFQVKSETNYREYPVLPTSTVRSLDTIEDRIQVLDDLGYEVVDTFQWSGWLFLEESSAETIIRDFLIHDFAPHLKSKLRTFSAKGLGYVTGKFEEFNKMFVFLHLNNIYKNKAWVIVDGGIDGNSEENRVIKKLKETYMRSGWHEEQFRQFSQHEFEEYYPSLYVEKFRKLMTEVSKETDSEKRSKAKRKKKEELLLEVKKWYIEHHDEAKKAFAVSAREVIDILKEIEKALL